MGAECDEAGESTLAGADFYGSGPGRPFAISQANKGAPYRVAVTVCKDCKRGWKQLAPGEGLGENTMRSSCDGGLLSISVSNTTLWSN